MIDQRTSHLDLQLPHPSNELEDDIYRLRAALEALDFKAAEIDALLSSDDTTLDTVQELVLAIKENRTDIAELAAIATQAEAARVGAEQARDEAEYARDEAVLVASKYIVSPTQPANPPSGEAPLWWNGSTMRVWKEADQQWVDASSSVIGLRQTFTFSLASGQTVVSGADGGGSTLVFDRTSYIDVFLNGSRLVLDDDFTADVVAQSITLAQGGAADGLDVLEVVSYTNLTMVDADLETVFATQEQLQDAVDMLGAEVDEKAGLKESIQVLSGASQSPSISSGRIAIWSLGEPSFISAENLDSGDALTLRVTHNGNDVSWSGFAIVGSDLEKGDGDTFYEIWKIGSTAYVAKVGSTA